MDYHTIRKLSRIAEPATTPCPLDAHLPADVVPLSDFYTIVAEVLSLDPLGFHEESVGRWTKVISPDLSHVLYVHPVSETHYELSWGVDLERMSRPNRHTPDLFESVTDYVLTSRHELDRIRAYQIASSHGCASVAHDANRVWRHLRPIVFAWWECTTTLDEVADRARRQSLRNWVGPAHDPDPAEVETVIRTHGWT